MASAWIAHVKKIANDKQNIIQRGFKKAGPGNKKSK